MILCLVVAISVFAVSGAAPQPTTVAPSTCTDEGYDYTYERYVGDGKCYQFGERGPCEEHMSLQYERETGNLECLCDYSPVREFVKWTASNTCFLIHSQGPCVRGEWLTYKNGTPSCQPTPCTDVDVNATLYFSHNKTCYCADDAPYRNGDQVDCGLTNRGSNLCPSEKGHELTFKPPGYFTCAKRKGFSSTNTHPYHYGSAGQNIRGDDVVHDEELTVTCDTGQYDPFVEECVL